MPPSEGKTPGKGKTLDLEKLSFPQLNPARQQVAKDLIQVSSGPQGFPILGVSARLAPEVEANTKLFKAPTSCATEIYSGVLYQAAQLRDPQISAAAQKHIRIVSALWGLLTPQDQIPSYRLKMDTELPKVGKLTSYWRPQLRQILSSELIVDCCSAAYQKAWHPDRKEPGFTQIVQVKAIKGSRVVSHWAKHYRGVLCRKLLEASAELHLIRDLKELASLADSLLAPEARVDLEQSKQGSFLLISLPD